MNQTWPKDEWEIRVRVIKMQIGISIVSQLLESLPSVTLLSTDGRYPDGYLEIRKQLELNSLASVSVRSQHRFTKNILIKSPKRNGQSLRENPEENSKNPRAGAKPEFHLQESGTEKWIEKMNRKINRKLIGKTPAADALGSPRQSPLGRENVSPFSRASDEDLTRKIWKVVPIKDTHSTKTDAWCHWIYPSPSISTIVFQISQWQKVTIQEPYHTHRKYFIFLLV